MTFPVELPRALLMEQNYFNIMINARPWSGTVFFFLPRSETRTTSLDKRMSTRIGVFSGNWCMQLVRMTPISMQPPPPIARKRAERARHDSGRSPAKFSQVSNRTTACLSARISPESRGKKPDRTAYRKIYGMRDELDRRGNPDPEQRPCRACTPGLRHRPVTLFTRPWIYRRLFDARDLRLLQ